jgi:membrane-associated phospholipid phosphatase
MRHLSWLLPLIVLIAFAPFSSSIDLNVSRSFFHDGHFTTSPWIEFVYKYGELPGFLIGGGATLIFGLSYFVPRLHQWRRAAGAITLAFFLGPGLLINLGFKEHWGRPRPRQIEEFGGSQTFRPFYNPAPSWNEDYFKSFPSGHVSMGALYLCLCLVGIRERNITLAWAGLILSVVLIPILAYARIAVGGHFVSDTLVSIFLVWWVSLASCRIVYGPSEQ